MMTKAAFAKLVGVTAATLTNAIQKGVVAQTEDKKIDPLDPTAVAYLQQQSVRQGKMKSLDLPDPESVTPTELEGIDFDHPEQYVNRYPDPASRDKVAATLKRLVEIRRHEQARRKEAGTLIERTYVAQRFAAFGEALRQQLLSLPRRGAAQLTARARSGGEQAVEEYLADEIDAAIARSLEELSIE